MLPQLFDALAALGPHPSLGVHAETYGRLIGSWAGEVHDHTPLGVAVARLKSTSPGCWRAGRSKMLGSSHRERRGGRVPPRCAAATALPCASSIRQTSCGG